MANSQQPRQRRRLLHSSYFGRDTVWTLQRAIALFAASDADVFGFIAEGYTSVSVLQGANIAFRFFSTPDMASICAKAAVPAQLEIVQPLEFVVGQIFHTSRIVVVALDSAGGTLDPVPIAVEAEIAEPPFINGRSDVLSEGHIQPLRPGSFRFRVRTICPGTSTEVIVPAIIH